MKLRNINWYGFFLHCVIIILSVLVVRLTVQNNSLANKLKSISVERIKKGEVLSSLVLEDLNKRKVNISSLNHEYKVVFVFSTTCNFCKSSIPVINQINTSCPNEVSVIGLSNDNIDETNFFSGCFTCNCIRYLYYNECIYWHMPRCPGLQLDLFTSV